MLSDVVVRVALRDREARPPGGGGATKAAGAWVSVRAGDSSSSKGTEKRAIVSWRRLADIFPSKRTYGILSNSFSLSNAR